MSDLHIALLALAGVLLLGLVAHNKWQERRELRRLGRSLHDGVGDALLDPAPASAPPSPRATTQERIEPKLDMPAGAAAYEASTGTADGAPPVIAPASGWVEDPMLDCVVEVRCAHPVDGVAVLDAVSSLTRNPFALPVHVAVWDARHQQWSAPDRFGFTAELLVAVQLAHRHHALDEIEVSRFLAAVEQIALALDADFDAPDAARILQLARELDGTLARFDVQIGLTLESRSGTWDAARLANAGRDVDLSPDGPLCWTRANVEGQALYSMSTVSVPADRLSLEFNVPLAPPESEPLRMMFDGAVALAAQLGARMVDDNARPIDAQSIAAIETQLETLIADMRAAGIEPGSLRAQRLYG